jgi:hypothetical protein
VQREAGEAHEREPVAQPVLGLLVRGRAERLQDENPKRQHRVPGRAAAAAVVGARERRLEVRAEGLEVHRGAEPLQRVARGRQPPQPLLRVEEPRLLRHPRPRRYQAQRIRSGRVEASVLRGVQLLTDQVVCGACGNTFEAIGRDYLVARELR